MAGYDIGPRIGIKGESEFNAQIKKINNSLKEYSSEMSALTSEFEENANSQQALISKNKVLQKQLEGQGQKMSALQSQYDKEVAKLKELATAYQKISTEMGENSTEASKAENAYNKQAESVSKLKVAMNETQSIINKLNNTVDKNGQMLDEIESGARDAATGLETLSSSADEVGDGLESLGGKLDAGNLMQATEMLSEVGDKLKEVGSNAIEAASDWDGATAKMQANLGLTSDEAEHLQDVAKQVFEQGIAPSVDVASEAVMLVKQNFKDLSDTDLSNLSNQLVGISERTGTDLQENMRGVDQLMTAFGLDGKEAMDLIAAGYQNNLNSSGDFMDTINEYAPLFSEAGFSAEQMLAILDSGMENGALNTDKVADAVKELQIKLGDGTFEQNMGMFSQATQDMFYQWKDGEATVSQVASSIGEDLKKMTPTEQQQALSVLSSQFEDLGIDASVSLLSVGDGFTDATGKADEFAKATDSEKWQGNLNKITDSLSTIGETVLDTLTPVLEFVADLIQSFSELPAPVQTVLTVLGGLIGIFTTLAPFLSSGFTIIKTIGTILGGSLIPAISGVLTALAPILPIIAAVAAAIGAIILIIQNWGAISDWFGGVWSSLKETLSNAWEAIKNTAETVFNSIKDFFSNIWETIKSTVSNSVNSVKETISNVWESIKNVVTTVTTSIKDGAVNGFRSLVNGVRSVLSGISNTIKSAFDGAINFITSLPGKAVSWGRDFINSLKNGIMAGVSGIVNAVKGVANKIRSFLHFSRPDEGPLRDYETWMPDMLTGMADSVYKNLDIIQDAAKTISGTINSNITDDRNGVMRSAQTSYSSSIVVQGDSIILDGKVIGRTADRYISNGQRARLKAKGAYA